MKNNLNNNGSEPGSAPATERLGRLMALTSALFLGLNTTLARLAYDGGSNPGTVVFIRFIITALAIALLMVLIRRKFTISKAALMPILGVGLSSVFQGATYLSSVAYIPVGLAVLLFYTYPLMVAAASWIVDKQKIDKGRIIAFLVAFLGIGLAIGPSFDVLDWRGVVLALMGACGVMCIFMFTSRALNHANPVSISFYSNLFAIPFMTVVMITMMDDYQPPETSLGITGLLAACILYALAIMLQYAAILAIGKTMTAFMNNLEPLISISAAALLLGETLSGTQYLGGLVVIIALVTSDWIGTRRHA
ncbi:MAG: EamA family transporter [Rhodospirillales bacterium]|nr:EamA family transporter [Rhodospirillales bacterium]